MLISINSTPTALNSKYLASCFLTTVSIFLFVLLLSLSMFASTDRDDNGILNPSDELIDAHSEIRMPINYYENERTGVCYFTLISDTNAWQYILKSDGK